MIPGGTAPAYRDLRSYSGPICPSISHGRCVEPASKDVDWPELLGQILRVVHTDVFGLVTFPTRSPKDTNVGMTNYMGAKSYFVTQLHNYIYMYLSSLFSFCFLSFKRSRIIDIENIEYKEQFRIRGNKTDTTIFLTERLSESRRKENLFIQRQITSRDLRCA